MIQTCPACFSADDVSFERLPDRIVAYTCSRDHGGDGVHRWLTPLNVARVLDDQTGGGVTDELLDPLSNCVLAGEPYVEYGIVELRFRQRYGVALGRLRDRGELVSFWAPATGAWAPQDITYWARRPEPATHARVTWSEWCEQNGRPDTWTEEDIAAANAR